MASNADEVPVDNTTTATPTTPAPSDTATTGEEDGSLPQGEVKPAAAGFSNPYGSAKPVTLETNFSRPYKAISSSANSDFSLLNDLERLIRGSYRKPTGGLRSDRGSQAVYLSISRMENSHRVGRELIRAAQNGVEVYVIHGKASQSKESRYLQSKLNALPHGHFKICSKGKSLACLSSLNGAIMHSKILLVTSTYTRDNKPASAAIWSGSANLGGPSGERTYNNGLTVYNDYKLWKETRQMWTDMWAERNVNSNYTAYIKAHNSRYGITETQRERYGYTKADPVYGMFYSNLANVTIYPTPIRATPTNGKDPVLMLLKRVIPDDQCRIRLQENRFKYRRIAVAQRLVELAEGGCKISGVYFEDDLKVNRTTHCQIYIRVCRPILDVFKTSSRTIEAAWAKPHDKTILVEAKLRPNFYNPEERLPNGSVWPTDGARATIVQAGSAALTGSNLVASDEITTETTDPAVYDAYLEHWKAILQSHEYRNYPY
ncbi:phospholipase D-like domain-containing protein [Aeromicrobium ginsengisoli]|uniref:Phospholipase D-like domain-containing protein n=1 Tax=Aeromicrobium ginsengisoli TaxID=363867 RepID=A0A5M4FHC2_9ACTN|nr:phospholipase D-like domain-containing protein [Aeromicrobium ginsengisoli]KAA1399639.1 hypothetical protein ESP70_002425 [Aeromicrobium ginsengisoli]